MTDSSAIGTHADLQLGSVKAPPPPTLLPNGTSSLDDAVPDELSSTIKCICGFNDDDGNTVLCEVCNTWQHIECYYPDQIVPDIHECLEDQPRVLDKKGAAERQKQLREQQILGDRRVKRPTTKSHKKKTKDSIVTNGWVMSDRADSAERPSGSPRDQPPPAKRPKTSHRASASIASLNQMSSSANSRRKHAVGNLSGQSPVKSPPGINPNGYNGEYFSQEFMQLHQKPPFQLAEANSFTSIGLANEMATWLQDPDALAEVANGADPRKVFWRPDRSFADLENIYPQLRKHTEEDKSITFSGMHPVVERLTVDSAIPANAMIGEIRGHISRVDEYTQDPSNRWTTLRHVEPFVFSPPHLPIVIDAREEGTLLRYIRRSCQPNTQMKIIIDKGRDYHFCFVSQENIEEGEEITLGWDIDGAVHKILSTSYSNGNIKKEGIHGEDEQFISNWVSRLLANFGGCACARPDGFCMLGRFDRRNQHLSPDGNGNTLKPPKGRKGKRNLNHISPLSTGQATNSRASSEATYTRTEQFDDRADSRSASGSSRSKPTSRDNTPGASSIDAMTGLGVELSERERRKMQQIERRFDLLDHHDDGTGKKKKRNSGGSALNTPNVATSKQLGFTDSLNPSPTLASSSKSFRSLTVDANGVNGNMRSSRNSSGNGPVQIQARPVYVDTYTQTEADREQFYNTQLATPKRKRPSYAQRLLSRTREGTAKRVKTETTPASPGHLPPQPATVASSTQTQSPPAAQSPPASMLPPPKPAAQSPRGEETRRQTPEHSGPPAESQDVDMEDAPPGPVPTQEASKPWETTSATAPPPPGTAQEPSIESQAQVEPPAPPWTARPSSPTSNKQSTTQHIDPLSLNTTANDPTEVEPVAPVASEQIRTPTDAEPTSATSATSSASHRPQNLHVTLPPVPSFPSPTPTTPSVTATPGSMTGSSYAQSPLSTTTAPGPLFSPAIQSAVAPSPLKKKLSLSDYTNRKRKNEAQAAAKEAAAAAEKGKDSKLPAVSEGSSAAENKDKEGEMKADSKDKEGQADGSAIEDVDMPLAPLKGTSDADKSSVADDKVAEDKSEVTDALSTTGAQSEGKPDAERDQGDAATT